MKLIDRALDFIFPPVCGICCKYEESYICKECENKLKVFMNYNIREVNNKSYQKHLWLFRYEGIIRDIILDYKFNEKSYIYLAISKMIINNKEAIDFFKKADYVIPVPIHKKRYKERGYNQCNLVAKRISSILNVKYLPNTLLKNKNTLPQSSLNSLGRIENIKEAFSVRKDVDFNGKTVILFDDIYTTGSTVEECCKQLKILGCRAINVFTIAKK